MLDQHGKLVLARDRSNVDVEVEMRRKLEYNGEDSLSDSLYSWWRQGGWFGDVDSSDDFHAPSTFDGDDDDTTSMISISTNESNAEQWSDMDEDASGRRTPTQLDPYGDRRRDITPTPSEGLALTDLARLLNPQSTADRDEALRLSHILRSDRPTTRAQYRRATDRNRMQLLSPHTATHLSEQEEERDLELFILDQRSKARLRSANQNGGNGTWESGAEGMGAGGPQCVVCQSTPRTILVWPCGCLSMCNDCRMGLAARNYSKCICCRTDVAAYSRLYVP